MVVQAEVAGEQHNRCSAARSRRRRSRARGKRSARPPRRDRPRARGRRARPSRPRARRARRSRPDSASRARGAPARCAGPRPRSRRKGRRAPARATEPRRSSVSSGVSAAEVCDAPSMRSQREPESDEAELVLLTRDAGEQRHRPDASAPAAREPEQPPAYDPRGEVLLRDGGLAACPALAEIVQVGEDDVRERGVERRRGQQPVERRLRPRLVIRVERTPAARRATPPTRAVRRLARRGRRQCPPRAMRPLPPRTLQRGAAASSPRAEGRPRSRAGARRASVWGEEARTGAPTRAAARGSRQSACSARRSGGALSRSRHDYTASGRNLDRGDSTRYPRSYTESKQEVDRVKNRSTLSQRRS